MHGTSWLHTLIEMLGELSSFMTKDAGAKSFTMKIFFPKNNGKFSWIFPNYDKNLSLRGKVHLHFPYIWQKTFGPGEKFPRFFLNMTKISICWADNSYVQQFQLLDGGEGGGGQIPLFFSSTITNYKIIITLKG